MGMKIKYYCYNNETPLDVDNWDDVLDFFLFYLTVGKYVTIEYDKDRNMIIRECVK